MLSATPAFLASARWLSSLRLRSLDSGAAEDDDGVADTRRTGWYSVDDQRPDVVRPLY